MKHEEVYILYLLILCVVVGCKGTFTFHSRPETDEYAGTCVGEKRKLFCGWIIKEDVR